MNILPNVISLIEELDYKREAQNARKFASLYLVDKGTAIEAMPDVNGKGVIVPEFLPDLCTEDVLVMSWVHGTKLTEVAESAGRSNEQTRRENLELIELATQCTLSQLLDTGTLHADPHGESSLLYHYCLDVLLVVDDELLVLDCDIVRYAVGCISF